MTLLLNQAAINRTHLTPEKGGKYDIIFGNETIYIPFGISVFGLIGNLMTFVTIVRTQHLRRVCSYFFIILFIVQYFLIMPANYANTYILVLCVSDSVAMMQMFLRFWVELDTITQLLCYVERYIWCTAIYVSNLAVISLTMERFFAIVFPLQHMQKADFSRWKITCFWLFPTVVLSFNILYALKSTEHDSVDLHYSSENTNPIKCTFDYEKPFVDIIFHIPRLIFSYLLTLFVVVSVNLVILAKLRARSIFTGESMSKDTQATSIILMVIPTVYVILNSPFWIRTILKFFMSNSANFSFISKHYLLTISSYIFFCMTFATNFLVYALISPKFRAAFLNVWLCRPDTSRQSSTIRNATTVTSVRMNSCCGVVTNANEQFTLASKDSIKRL